MSSEEGSPEVGDLVIASVAKVVDYGAYVKLDEYGGKEGLIHISEIATTWVKNIREHVRQGQKLVLKVLRINPRRGEIDLSLRRVTGRERSDKMLLWKQEKKAESIIKSATDRIKETPDTYQKIKNALLEKYDGLYEAFEEVAEEGEEVFTKAGLSEDWSRILAEITKSKIRPERFKLAATVELASRRPDGIESIKAALINARKIKKPRGSSINVYAIGAPRYRIEVAAREVEGAQQALDLAVNETLKSIKANGGEGRKVS